MSEFIRWVASILGAILTGAVLIAIGCVLVPLVFFVVFMGFKVVLVLMVIGLILAVCFGLGCWIWELFKPSPPEPTQEDIERERQREELVRKRMELYQKYNQYE